MITIIVRGKNIQNLFPTHAIYIKHGWEVVGDIRNVKPEQLYEVKGFDETQKLYTNSNIRICNVFIEECVTVEGLTQEHLSEDNAIKIHKEAPKSDENDINTNEYKSSIDIQEGHVCNSETGEQEMSDIVDKVDDKMSDKESEGLDG